MPAWQVTRYRLVNLRAMLSPPSERLQTFGRVEIQVELEPQCNPMKLEDELCSQQGNEEKKKGE